MERIKLFPFLSGYIQLNSEMPVVYVVVVNIFDYTRKGLFLVTPDSSDNC